MKAIALIVMLAAPAVSVTSLPAQSRKELVAEYGRRVRALDKKDVAGMLELAAWCHLKKLETYAGLWFRKVLKRDPQNDAANAGIGNEKVAGAWYSPDEAAKVRARIEAEKRAAEAAKAAAENAGKTGDGEEAALAAVDRRIEANRTEAGKLLDGWLKATGAALPKYKAAISDHVLLVAKAPTPKHAQLFTQIGEYVYRRLNTLTFGKADAKTFSRCGDRVLFYLGDDAVFDATMDWIKGQHPEVNRFSNVDEGKKDVRKYELEFITFHWPPIHVHLNPENQAAAVANVMAHSWLEHNAKPQYAEPDIRTGRNKEFSMMNWMLEGAGIWAALDAVGVNRLYRIQKPQYANQKFIDKDVELNYPAIAYEIATEGKSEGRTARTLYQLSRARMNTWHVLDICQSFALVDYLIQARSDDWRALVARLKQARTFRGAFVEQFGTKQQIARAHEALDKTHDDADLEVVYREVTEAFEKPWKAWVETTYEKLRDDDLYYRTRAPFPQLPKKKS